MPPRDKQGAQRYNQHLPFQVFCCESGTHVVDPAQSYYKGIKYRAGNDFHNLSRADGVPVRGAEAPCLDSSQAWFCRDLWVRTAHDDMLGVGTANGGAPGKVQRREVVEVAARDPLMERRDEEHAQKQHRDEIKVNVGGGADMEEVNDGVHADRKKEDPDANAGSDYDAMPPEEGGEDVPPPEPVKLSIPNSAFRPARILVNPRCPTTYAGVTHTQLARDLFGERDGDEKDKVIISGKYLLDDWEGAPESFVCQEQRLVFGGLFCILYFLTGALQTNWRKESTKNTETTQVLDK